MIDGLEIKANNIFYPIKENSKPIPPKSNWFYKCKKCERNIDYDPFAYRIVVGDVFSSTGIRGYNICCVCATYEKEAENIAKVLYTIAIL